MKPLPRVEGRSSGNEKQADLKSQPTITLPASCVQASTLGLPPEILGELYLELSRRLARAEVLLLLSLPDPGFDLLTEEIHRFNQACLAHAAAPRRAAA